MTVPKLELEAAHLAARLKMEICRALTVTVDKVIMWIDSTTALQWIIPTNKNPIFTASRVIEILENTSVDQWNHVATCDNPTEAGTHGMSTEVLQSGSSVRRPDFLRTKQFTFVTNTDVVDNIKLGGVTKEPDDECISSLAASVTKPVMELSSPIIPFDKFSCCPFPVTAYMLRFHHITKVTVP